jgi:hypothetical protein
MYLGNFFTQLVRKPFRDLATVYLSTARVSLATCYFKEYLYRESKKTMQHVFITPKQLAPWESDKWHGQNKEVTPAVHIWWLSIKTTFSSFFLRFNILSATRKVTLFTYSRGRCSILLGVHFKDGSIFFPSPSPSWKKDEKEQNTKSRRWERAPHSVSTRMYTSRQAILVLYQLYSRCSPLPVAGISAQDSTCTERCVRMGRSQLQTGLSPDANICAPSSSSVSTGRV